MTSDTSGGLLALVEGVGVVEQVERLVELLVGDLAAVHGEPGEECPVEDALDGLVLAGADVQLVRIVQQVKRGQEHLSAGLQLAGGRVELPGELGLFLADGGQLGAQLVLGPAFLSGQVEEVTFLAVELLQLLGECGAHLVAQLEVFSHGRLDAAAHGCPQLWRQDDGVGVVLLHGLLHDVDRDVGLIAELLLTSPAQEVEVFAAVSSTGHDREAVLAAAAPDQPLEKVQVLALTGAAPSVAVHDPLHPVEQLLINQRFVPSLVLDALVEHLAEVVAVAQHAPERFPANRRGATGSG